MAGFVSLHFPISVTLVETKEILTSKSEAQLRKVHPPERVGDCGVPLGLLVWIAGSPGDGGSALPLPASQGDGRGSFSGIDVSGGAPGAGSCGFTKAFWSPLAR